MDFANGTEKAGRVEGNSERQRIRRRSNAILVKSVLRVTIAEKSVRGRNKPFAYAAGECHIERMRLDNDDRRKANSKRDANTQTARKARTRYSRTHA